MANRLIHTTSPYLLQHAHNPVDWWPWGEEAFAEARATNKPIFVSVGYSTCYWCHVMERQSFENEEVAGLLNERFVCIKVDREERPDVDQLYMTATQVMTRHGGWPMSVFLTPDLRPFYAGTYFPPEDGGGRMGFKSLIRALHEAWVERPGDIEKTAGQMRGILQELAVPPALEEGMTVDAGYLAELVERCADDYEPAHGGFGQAPKFPRQTLLSLFLTALESIAVRTALGDRAQVIARRVCHTLDAMAAGGIRDHLGGGFHRYSTDSKWLVPHFEIMLYDNAMLAGVYARAARVFGRAEYGVVARGICEFVLNEMTREDGVFFTALDAETNAKEGETYLWTLAEVEGLLPAADAKVFAVAYGLDRGPNFADPHHGTGIPDSNVLYLPRPLETVARDMGIAPAELEGLLARSRAVLLAARKKRQQPMLDTKVVTSWNGLMIEGLAVAGEMLGEKSYVEAAGRAAEVLLAKHRLADGTLLRVSRDGKAGPAGFLDDYAHLCCGLVALGKADAARAEYWTERGQEVAGEMMGRFVDLSAGGFYFTAAEAKDMLVRQKTGGDSPLPSGNGAAAVAMVALGHSRAAQNVLTVFASQIASHAESMSTVLEAAVRLVDGGVVVKCEPGKPPVADNVALPVPIRMTAAWVEPTRLMLHVAVEEGYHVKAGMGDGKVMPLRVTVEGGEVVYPKAQKLTLGGEVVSAYTGVVTVEVRFGRVPTQTVKVVVAAQPCSESECLMAVKKVLEIAPAGL
jgi:uncharacterized protein YyaL (SSP411 family)